MKEELIKLIEQIDDSKVIGFIYSYTKHLCNKARMLQGGKQHDED